MSQIRLTIDPDEVAAHIAHQDSIQQARFLSTFLDEMSKDCGTSYATQKQLAHIRRSLQPEHRELFNMLTEKGC